jgi:hypothetical protein
MFSSDFEKKRKTPTPSESLVNDFERFFPERKQRSSKGNNTLVAEDID